MPYAGSMGIVSLKKTDAIPLVSETFAVKVSIVAGATMLSESEVLKAATEGEVSSTINVRVSELLRLPAISVALKVSWQKPLVTPGQNWEVEFTVEKRFPEFESGVPLRDTTASTVIAIGSRDSTMFIWTNLAKSKP